jgi:hypothetical protein
MLSCEPRPSRLSSSISIPEVFSPPLRPKEMPGFSVQTSWVITSTSTTPSRWETGRIHASLR